MANFIISIVLGLIPEVLYLTLFISGVKDKKEKKLKLFMFLVLGYILLIMICRYQLLFYVLYIIYAFIVVKKLYKAHIIDLFIISLAYIYMTFASFISYKLTSNYYIAYIIHLIILYIIFIFNNKLKIFYKIYKKLWNVSKDNKIKSITLRNVSLLIINIMIILMNAIMLFLISRV